MLRCPETLSQFCNGLAGRDATLLDNCIDVVSELVYNLAYSVYCSCEF